MADKYEEISKQLIKAVGEKENVIYFQHCTTRLRLNVKDRGLVDLDTIKKTDKVLGTQWSNDELQIIIGPQVANLYDSMCNIGGFQKKSVINENLDANLEKKGKMTPKSIVMGMIDGISGSIVPIIPMMIGGGMIKVIYMILNMIGILPETSSTYQILYWVGDAFIYFFPVYLGATSARKFKTNMGLGMLLGALLIYPSFIAAVTDGTAMTIFGLPVYMTNYSSTVIPIIMTTWVMSKVEKGVDKFIPDFLKAALVPTITILIMIPAMLVVIAPVGYYIGTFITSAVIWIYETIGWLGVGVLASLLPLMVATGMHTLMTPYWVSAFATLGNDPFFLPAMILSNLNVATASLAVGLKAKGEKAKSTAISCSTTAFIAGVTEPAMFGIAFRYKKPLYAVMIGNLASGILAGLLKVACYAFPGSGGLFAIVTFTGPNGNLVKFLICTAVGIAVTFVTTWIMGFDEEVDA